MSAGCFCCQEIGIRYAPGVLSGNVNEVRALGAAVDGATNGHLEEVGAAVVLNRKPKQAGAVAARPLPRPIGTEINQEHQIVRRPRPKRGEVAS
jgi:hypothetical protein